MEIQAFRQAMHHNIDSVMAGCQKLTDLFITAALIGGHVLLEDVPGTGKTTLAKVFSRSIAADFKRIQFTPDLLPSDITGTTIYREDEHRFEFRPGPIFTEILLADEINRAAPRTQSSLLEAMEEHQVSVDGLTYPLPAFFFVLATQNPIESAGTFPLPEAQIDRFLMRLSIGYPELEEEKRMLQKHSQGRPLDSISSILTPQEFLSFRQQWMQVHLCDALTETLLKLVDATRHHEKIAVGISPRAALSMVQSLKAYAFLQGRDYVLPDDLKILIHPLFDHRLVLNNTLLQSRNTALLLDEIFSSIPLPTEHFRAF